jgi:tetratricopeptide (TPR) repeat protein
VFLLSSLFGIAPPPTIAAIVFDWLEGAVILFLVVHLLASGWRPQVFVLATLLASSLFLLAYLADLLGWWVQWMQLWQPGMALIPSGARLDFGGTHPNQAALLINLGVPLAIAALWQAPAFWQRGLWVLWLLGATVALFATSSRGGWLAMVAASATMVVPLLWSALRARRWRRILTTLLLGGGYAALFLALFVMNLQEVQAQRGRVPAAQQQAAPATTTPTPQPEPTATSQPEPTATSQPTAAPAAPTSGEQSGLEQTARVLADSAGRTTFFSRALEFFAERPLLGLGPEGYATRYTQVEPHSRLFPAQHAHSIYFQVLSEWGALGGVSLLLLIGMTLRLWWRGWHTAAPLLPDAATAPAPSPEGRLLLLACGAAGTGLAVHGLVEVPVVSITILYMALLAVALASGGGWHLRSYPAAAEESASPSSPIGSLWRGIRRVHPLHTLIVLIAILAWGSGGTIVLARSANEARLDTARTALQRGNAAQAVDRYTRSIEAYPWVPAAYYERATALAWLAREQPALLPDALAAQATAVAYAPAHRIVAPVNEAALLLEMGDAERAAERLHTAIETTTPRWAVPRMLRAQIDEQAGDTEAARTHWRWVLRREPELAASAACLRSAICPTVPLPQKEYAALEEARALLQQPDATALREIERLASAWRSVDIWAVGVMAAERANDPQARARFLAAARAESENVTKEVTPLLAVVLLRDALARNDQDAVRELTQTWLAASDMRFVPQLTRHLVTPTDLALAQALVDAARFLDDAALLEQAQHRLAFVEAALPEAAPQQR